ncbi:MAG: DUF2007 domain-containing protein [Anaerovoracaceae bacterium]
MFIDEKERQPWRDGVYLCTAESSFEADLLESKLRSEDIPSVKNYQGASNFIEIALGSNSTYPIDLYVPQQTLEDARNIIVAVPLEDSEELDVGDKE